MASGKAEGWSPPTPAGGIEANLVKKRKNPLDLHGGYAHSGTGGKTLFKSYITNEAFQAG